MQYNCIIIEDEPLAVEIIENYISQVPFLKLLKICNDAIEALHFLRNTKVDLIFLDLHLPKLKGMDFLATLSAPPRVIVTTAYHDYALKGYEFSVMDYLLKPIEFSRFLAAVNKLSLSRQQETGAEIEERPERKHMFFNMNKKKIKVYLDDILYMESQKEYIRIVTTSKEVVTRYALSDMNELLSGADFLRIHRSFIISKKRIEAFNSTDVEIGGRQIPIGRSYKELVQTVLSGMFRSH